MKDRIEFVKNVMKRKILKKWKQTISLHEVREDRLLQKIARCFVEIVIGEKATNNIFFQIFPLANYFFLCTMKS
jgi:hypothetical protein